MKSSQTTAQGHNDKLKWRLAWAVPLHAKRLNLKAWLDFGNLASGTACPLFQLIVGMSVHPSRDFNLTHHHALARRDSRLKKRNTLFTTARWFINETNGENEFNHVGSSHQVVPAKCGRSKPPRAFPTLLFLSLCAQSNSSLSHDF